MEEEMEENATGAGSGRGAANTMEEIGETVKVGDTPSPANQGPTSGRRHQKRATWVKVVAAGGVNIPAVFSLFGLNLGGKVVHRSRNRRPGAPQKGGTEEEKGSGGF